MFLFQILLPLYAKNNRRISRAAFKNVNEELTRRYGGVTAYLRAPAEGQWVSQGRKDRDQIVTIEVMTRSRDLRWWKRYRKTLEERFRQEHVIVRYYPCELV